MKKDIYQDVTNKIVNEIESGALPWVKEWSGFSGLPENAITGRQYNGINTLILWLMGGELGFSSHCIFHTNFSTVPDTCCHPFQKSYTAIPI